MKWTISCKIDHFSFLLHVLVIQLEILNIASHLRCEVLFKMLG